MIFGIGTDILEVERFKNKLSASNTRLINTLFTSSEIEYCRQGKSKAVQAQRFTARFAAKEAFLKALGTGLRNGITWHDLEVAHTELGKPVLNVNGTAAVLMKESRITRTHLSLSHSKHHATATVILEQEP